MVAYVFCKLGPVLALRLISLFIFSPEDRLLVRLKINFEVVSVATVTTSLEEHLFVAESQVPFLHNSIVILLIFPLPPTWL